MNRLFVAIALILRNVWVWCHLNWLAVHRGPGIYIREELLRLGEMLLWLQTFVEDEFELCVFKNIPPPSAFTLVSRSRIILYARSRVGSEDASSTSTSYPA